MTVEQGEYIAIMGPSGSGKTTLMNLLGCLDVPTSGKYYLEGQDIGTLSDDALADIRNNSIGFVFQNFHLLPKMTALDNVALPLLYRGIPLKDRRLRAEAALKLMGLGDRLDFYPNQLSGGQQQRVAIARALMNKPPVILADEPTGNLDSRASVEIVKFLQDLNSQGITIIMVTHEDDIASYAKRQIVVKDGKIAKS
jgi:putative ABC transport system ATP-binding protein